MGTIIIIPVLQKKKLSHRGVMQAPKVTQIKWQNQD